MTHSIEALRAALPNLSARDQHFAEGLILQHEGGRGGNQRGLSDKQWHWVGELTKRATEPPQKRTTDVGSVKGIVDLLERAAQHLKRPALIVRANDRDLRLNIAGARASMPGSINVCSADGYADREWYGRITRDGQFEPSRKFDATTQTAVAGALQAMASDPAKAAADYGRLTGVCCFCNTPLGHGEDKRSTQVGYGPVCAKNWGLPWGAKQ